MAVILTYDFGYVSRILAQRLAFNNPPRLDLIIVDFFEFSVINTFKENSVIHVS